MDTGITFTFAAIFLGAAVLSSLALYARQPIIIALDQILIPFQRAAQGPRIAAKRIVPCKIVDCRKNAGCHLQGGSGGNIIERRSATRGEHSA